MDDIKKADEIVAKIDSVIDSGLRWLRATRFDVPRANEIEAKLARNVADLKKANSGPYGRPEAIEELYAIATKLKKQPAYLVSQLSEARRMLA